MIFVFVGDDEDSDWIQGEMVKWFDMKVRGRIGDGVGDQEEMVVLGRTIKWCSWGLEYKADPGHREQLMRMFGFEKNSLGTATTGEKGKEVGEEEDEWERPEAKDYRGGAALLNYYAQACPEIQFPAKESSRDMARPKPKSWGKLKRAVGFVVGRQAALWRFELHE